jgi:signal transduction histidine kinase/ligand-binding sensor domain-containing protein
MIKHACTKTFKTRLQFIWMTICGLVLPHITSGQSFSFKHYTVEDGLNTSTVYYATQDLQSNMWFATEQGVCKFDGKTFTRYTINDGLSDNEVLFIKTDSKGRVWFLTFNGHLSYYYKGKFHNESNTVWLKKAFLKSSYNTCFVTSEGKILLGSIGGGITLIENDSDVHVLPCWSIGNSYFENPDKTITIFAADSMTYLLNDHLITKLKTIYYGRRANCTSYINNRQFYSAIEGVIELNKGKEKVLIASSEAYQATSISGITEDFDSSLIVTSRTGVLWYPKGVYKKSGALSLLAGKIVFSLFIDKEFNYWFCTEGDGIYMLPANQKKYHNFTRDDGLANEVVNRVTKDIQGNILLGCNNSIVTKIKANGIENIILKLPSERNARILDVAIDNFENIYAASDWGLIKLTKSAQIPMPFVWGTGREFLLPVKTIISRSDSLFVATGYGVFDRRINKEIFNPVLGHTFDNTRTYSCFPDRQGSLWISNINGLCRVKNKQLTYFLDADSVLEKRILNIGEMSDSTLVLSTEGYGIIFFKNEKVINRFNESNGLSSNVCRRLFIRGNTLWVSTFQGLTKCMYKNNAISNIHIYNVNNGLLSNSVKDVYDDGEKIYVATEKGLCIMDNIPDEGITPPPPLYISDLTYSGMKFSMDTVLEFMINNPIKINFNAITFQNVSELLYRYRIRKLNEEWIETKNNSVEYSLTGAGKYDFEVQAKKIGSDWSKTAGVSFIMIPPFYKTTWFYILITAAAGFFIYYLTRFITQQRFKRQLALAKQNEMIEHERMRIASDMHDDIGADLTQISIWSNILNSTAKNEIVDKIVSSSNDVLQKVDSIIWALDSVHDSAEDLISYLRNYALNFLESSGISFSFESGNLIPDIKLTNTQRRNIYLVIKELLHNTVKHSGASNVEMQMAYSDGKLTIKYSDNGKGFNTSVLGDGLGFTTLQQRMQDIDSVFKFSSAPGKGFEAELTIKV